MKIQIWRFCHDHSLEAVTLDLDQEFHDLSSSVEVGIASFVKFRSLRRPKWEWEADLSELIHGALKEPRYDTKSSFIAPLDLEWHWKNLECSNTCKNDIVKNIECSNICKHKKKNMNNEAPLSPRRGGGIKRQNGYFPVNRTTYVVHLTLQCLVRPQRRCPYWDLKYSPALISK